MPVSIEIYLEQHAGSTSQPFHPAGQKYEYRQASNLTDKPARLTPRQAVFYRNLIRLSELLESEEIPIDFVDATGTHMAIDLGCVKIAEHAGFLKPLANGPDGKMRAVHLNWLVHPPKHSG